MIDLSVLERPAKRRRRVTPAHLLRGKAWLSFVLHALDTTPAQFSDRFLEGRKGGHASLVHKWLRGLTLPSTQTVIRISKEIPGSYELYSLPLWDLLIDRPLSRAAIAKIISLYWVEDDETLNHWKFPRSGFAAGEWQRPPISRYGGEDLMLRGDLYGFVALLALIREAEIYGPADNHWQLSIWIYRAIPAVAQLPWLRPHFELLKTCIQNIHARVVTSTYLVEVNWDVIEKLIGDDTDLAGITNEDVDENLSLEDPIALRVEGSARKGINPI